MVPHKLTLNLVELDHLAIKFTGNVGLPIFMNLIELAGDVDLFRHSAPFEREAGNTYATPDSKGSAGVAKNKKTRSKFPCCGAERSTVGIWEFLDEHVR